MKKIFFVFALLTACSSQAQQLFMAPTPFWQGVPTGAPSSQGARVRFDVVAGRWYSWTGSVWTALPWGIATQVGNSAPNYTPGVAQSPFVLVLGTGNLYHYVGPSSTDWVCRNCSADAQTLSWNGSNGELSISGGNTVGLDGRYLTAEVDGSTSNELQTLSQSGNTVTLSNGGGTVNVDPSVTNELQTLSLTGQTLAISSGNSVSIPVTSVVAGMGVSVSSSSGAWTVTNTGDLSATNEIQALSISGSTLSLSLGGGSVTVDPSSTNELQNLSLSGQSLSISGGAGVALPIVNVVAGADISVDVVGGVATVSATGGGGGIYGGSGTVPSNTSAIYGNAWLQFTDDFFYTGGPGIQVKYDDGAGANAIIGVGYDADNNFPVVAMSANVGSGEAGQIIFTPYGTQFAGEQAYFNVKNAFWSVPSYGTGIQVEDNRASKKGIEYVGDYSADLVNNPGSLTDVRTVQRLTGSATTVTGATSAIANAAAITAGLSVGDPYRWDDGFSIHLMFVR